MIKYGGTHPASFFDKKSTEIIKINNYRGILSGLGYFFSKFVVVAKYAYRDILNENKLLIGDKNNFSNKIAKLSVNRIWKNAFISLDKCEGYKFASNKKINSIYFFVGKQIISARNGTLTLFISFDEKEKKKIFSKEIQTFHHNWDLFAYELNEDEKNHSFKTIYISWEVTGNKKGIILSVPTFIPENKKTKNIIVLIADALRPKDIGLYSGNSLTPNTDDFFKEGLYFNNSYSQNNWTLPTFASMVTSLYSSEHKVVDPDNYLQPINRNVKTLPEALQEKQYYTFGSVSHFRCNQYLGHHRGFDHFSFKRTLDDKLGSPGIRGRNNMNFQIRELCDYLKNFSNKDFFGFLHLFDTHFPYLYNYNRKNINNLLFEKDLNSYIQKSFRNKLENDEYEFIYNEYKEKLKDFDHQLIELYELIKTMDNTTMILTSDHGYNFKAPLGKDLSKEEINTPFLVYSNDFLYEKGINERFIESSIDLAPTIAEICSLDNFSKRSGTSIFDPNYNITKKNYSISELTFHNNYQMKIIGEGNSSILIDGSMDRKSQKKYYETFSIKNYSTGNKSINEYKTFIIDIISKLNYDKEFVDSVNQIVKGI